MSFSPDAVTIIVDDVPLLSAQNPLGNDNMHLTRAANSIGWFENPCAVGCYGDSFSTVNGTATVSWVSKMDLASLSFFGRRPTDTNAHFTLTAIDPSSLANVSQSLPYPTSPPGLFFSVPVAQNSTVEFSNDSALGDQVEFDYLLAEVTNSTNLFKHQIFVDDSNPEISWSGSWSEKTDPAGASSLISNGNATHSSANVGDSFTFSFAGTSILVAGDNPIVRDCLLEMDFTIDNNSTLRPYQIVSGAPENTGLPHYVYLNTSLDSGNHTLTATITQIKGNVSASIDYLVYQPSFETLLQKPVFPKPSSAESPTTTASNLPPASNGKLSTGTIAGIVVGVIALLALLGVTLWMYRRYFSSRRRQVTSTSVSRPEHMHPEMVIVPFRPASTDLSYPSGPRTQGASESSTSVSQEKSRGRARSRSELQDTLHRQTHLKTQSAPSSDQLVSAPNQVELESDIREIRTRMETMSREMARYIVPPAYGTGTQ